MDMFISRDTKRMIVEKGKNKKTQFTLRGKCFLRATRTFRVGGYAVAGNAVSRGALRLFSRNNKNKVIGPVGGFVDGLQSVDETSWVCENSSVVGGAVIKNGTLVGDGIIVKNSSILSGTRINNQKKPWFATNNATISRSNISNCVFENIVNIDNCNICDKCAETNQQSIVFHSSPILCEVNADLGVALINSTITIDKRDPEDCTPTHIFCHDDKLSRRTFTLSGGKHYYLIDRYAFMYDSEMEMYESIKQLRWVYTEMFCVDYLRKQGTPFVLAQNAFAKTRVGSQQRAKNTAAQYQSQTATTPNKSESNPQPNLAERIKTDLEQPLTQATIRLEALRKDLEELEQEQAR